MQTVLQDEGLVKRVQVQNASGAGGTIGLAQFVTTESGKGDAVLGAGQTLQGAVITNKPAVTLDQVTPLARTVGEFEIIVVPVDSPIQTLDDLVAKLKADPAAASWGGGSVGSTDHIVAGLVMKSVGADLSKLNYIAHSGGGEALTSIMGGHRRAFAPVPPCLRREPHDQPRSAGRDRHDTWHHAPTSDSILGAFVLAIGVFIGLETWEMALAGTRTIVGPHLFPYIVSIGLIAVGLSLLREAVSGHVAHETGFELDWRAVGLASGGLVLQMLLLEKLGWIVATTLMFVLATLAFHERRVVISVLIGLALTVLTFMIFTYGLGLDLPLGSVFEALLEGDA